MITGYRQKEDLQEKYGVVIKIAKNQDDDKYIKLIIQSYTLESRQGCKREIDRLLSGTHQESPKKSDTESDDTDNDELRRFGLNHRSFCNKKFKSINI